MGVVLQFELVRGLYEAGSGTDRAPSEWPPHPARVFNALVSVSETDDDRGALRWLEAQAAPIVHASDRVIRCGGRTSYVPTNRVEPSNSYGSFPARKALGPVSWNAYSPAEPVVAFEWEGDCPDPVRETLAELVARVPYLGRSTSPVVGAVTDVARPGLARFRPTDDPSGLGTSLDVPAEGYLERLTEAYDDQRHAWEVPRRSVTYTSAPVSVPTDAATSPYSERGMIVLGIDRRLAPGHVVAVTSRLREAIEAHLDGGPVVLRGLRPRHLRSAEEQDLEQPRHQVIVAALPFVDVKHKDASGQVLGLAVLLPDSIAQEDRVSVLRGLAETVRSERGLLLGKLGRLQLDASVQPQETLRTRRWCRASHEWVSALPISANRHHRKLGVDVIERDLLRSCRDLDLPEPEYVEVSRGPMIPGAKTIAPRLRVRHPGAAATASYHARVRFAEPVRGPIVLGSMRRYGLGLMLPVSHQSEAAQ